MYSEISEAVRQTAAKSTLNGLMVWLGGIGLAAAARSGGMLAVIDQHAAAVRDALGDPLEGPDAVSLAGYASGVRDALIEVNWHLPQVSEMDWSAADWPTIRLLAVCSLARARDYV